MSNAVDNPVEPISRTTAIKCGNADMGVYLLDDIRDRLNERHLKGCIVKIKSIKSDGLTWVTITMDVTPCMENTVIVDGLCSYIRGMVVGILIWSGAAVI
jgi:hypothetical protein